MVLFLHCKQSIRNLKHNVKEVPTSIRSIKKVNTETVIKFIDTSKITTNIQTLNYRESVGDLMLATNITMIFHQLAFKLTQLVKF